MPYGRVKKCRCLGIVWMAVAASPPSRRVHAVKYRVWACRALVLFRSGVVAKKRRFSLSGRADEERSVTV